MSESTSNLKYLVFFAVLLIGTPSAYFLSLKFPKIEKIVFFLMIFFTVEMVDINFVSRETFRLTSRGFEIGMVDIATIVIMLLVLKRKHLFPVKIPPGSWLYALYLAFSALSIVNSAVILFSLFELWKMLRMYLYFWVVYNYINDLNQIKYLMRCLAVVVLYIFYAVIKQKYLEGRFQSYGPFPHQNSLVMYSIIIGSFFLSYLLNGRKLKFIHFNLWLTFFAMISVSVVATLSRAGLVLYGFSSIIVLGLSISSGINLRKIGVTFLLILVSLAVLAKAWNSISERFQTAPEESANVRKNLAIAALKMVKDEPLGVGLNNFGIKINPPWQYSSHIEMHNPDDEDEQNGLVETIYLMIAAECGWHTLISYLAFIFYFYYLNIRNSLRYARSQYRFVSIALIGGLLAIYLESTLEWVLKQTNNYYQLMLVFAVIGAMYKLSLPKRSDKAHRQSNTPEFPTPTMELA